jgi:hypothetical protein
MPSRNLPCCRAPATGSLAVLGLFFVAGCGLSDYERQMDEHTAIYQHLDEENRILDHPLEVPGDAEVKFFLRPPRGVYFKARASNNIVYENVTLYLYEGPPGRNVLVAANLQAAESKDRALAPKDFERQVRGGLVQYCKQMNGDPGPWVSEEATASETRTAIRPWGKQETLNFQTQTFTARLGAVDVQLFVYYLHEGQRQAAVIFQVPRNTQENGNETRSEEWSVKTLGLGSEFRAKAMQYVAAAKQK